MSLTEAQEVTLALVPKVTGALGFAGSAIILWDIWGNRDKSNPMLRALFGMSVFYMFDAMAWFLSSWMSPSSTGFAFAIGNVSTCAFQGFWLQAVIAGPLYKTVMVCYFYLVACHDSSLEKLRRLEPFLHISVLFFALGTSIAFLQDNQYNHVGAVCWVNGSPPQCGSSTFAGNPDVPCERGEHAWLYGMLMFYLPLWLCILLQVYFNAHIYFAASERDAKWVAQQALWYFLAFCVTWTPSTIWSAKHYKNGGSFRLDLAAAICEPLAGLFNLLIFLSNRPCLRRKLMAFLLCQSATSDRQDDDHVASNNRKDTAPPEQASSGSSTTYP